MILTTQDIGPVPEEDAMRFCLQWLLALISVVLVTETIYADVARTSRMGLCPVATFEIDATVDSPFDIKAINDAVRERLGRSDNPLLKKPIVEAARELNIVVPPELERYSSWPMSQPSSYDEGHFLDFVTDLNKMSGLHTFDHLRIDGIHGVPYGSTLRALIRFYIQLYLAILARAEAVLPVRSLPHSAEELSCTFSETIRTKTWHALATAPLQQRAPIMAQLDETNSDQCQKQALFELLLCDHSKDARERFARWIWKPGNLLFSEDENIPDYDQGYLLRDPTIVAALKTTWPLRNVSTPPSKELALHILEVLKYVHPDHLRPEIESVLSSLWHYDPLGTLTVAQSWRSTWMIEQLLEPLVKDWSKIQTDHRDKHVRFTRPEHKATLLRLLASRLTIRGATGAESDLIRELIVAVLPYIEPDDAASLPLDALRQLAAAIESDDAASESTRVQRTLARTAFWLLIALGDKPTLQSVLIDIKRPPSERFFRTYASVALLPDTFVSVHLPELSQSLTDQREQFNKGPNYDRGFMSSAPPPDEFGLPGEISRGAHPLRFLFKPGVEALADMFVDEHTALTVRKYILTQLLPSFNRHEHPTEAIAVKAKLPIDVGFYRDILNSEKLWYHYKILLHDNNGVRNHPAVQALYDYLLSDAWDFSSPNCRPYLGDYIAFADDPVFARAALVEKACKSKVSDSYLHEVAPHLTLDSVAVCPTSEFVAFAVTKWSQSEDDIISLLQTDRPEKRFFGLILIEQLGLKSTLKGVLRLVRDKDPVVRKRAKSVARYLGSLKVRQ